MTVLLYVVRRHPDDDLGGRYTFADKGVAEQAAAIVGGSIEPVPVMDAGSLRALRAEYQPAAASGRRA